MAKAKATAKAKAKPKARGKPETASARSQARAPAIEVFDLVRVFKGGVRAVDGIDFTVRRGEIYGFLGPNGAGKSTTVHMLTTLLPPTGGRALVGGFDVARQGPSVRRIIGAALQEVALDPILSGREHLAMQAALHGMPREAASKRSDQLLERVGLADAADRRAGTYSGGMKRRLDLALALVHRPAILFLDEPTTGLDVQSRTALWDEVRELAHDDGVTIFLTTQYLEEADALADNVGIIDRGRIVASGTPAQLKAQIGRPTVEVVPERQRDRALVEKVLSQFGEVAKGTRRGSLAVQIDATDGGLTRVVRELDRSKAQVANVELHRPTLADVFLAKTGRQLEGAESEHEETE